MASLDHQVENKRGKMIEVGVMRRKERENETKDTEPLIKHN